jgi:hypothetical protein
MFSYYLAASRGIVPGTKIFFGDGSCARAAAFWIASAALLSLPWALLRIKHSDSFAIGFLKLAAAVSASIPPLLGLVGWTNPLLAAGIFFPGLPGRGLGGAAAMLALWSLAPRKTDMRCALVAIFLGAALSQPQQALGHPGFAGIDTSFGRIASGSADPLKSHERMKTVLEELERRKANGELDSKNILLPETVCGTILSQNALEEWEFGILRILGRDWETRERTLFLGAEFMTPEKGGMKYDNTTFSIGFNRIRFRQKIPVPFSMYRPWDARGGANAYLFEPETVELRDGTRAGFIICYEQFLSWPWILMLSSGKPDVVLCTANNWWSRETSLPAIQARTRGLWSRLVGVPIVSAENI